MMLLQWCDAGQAFMFFAVLLAKASHVQAAGGYRCGEPWFLHESACC